METTMVVHTDTGTRPLAWAYQSRIARDTILAVQAEKGYEYLLGETGLVIHRSPKLAHVPRQIVRAACTH
jgi:hypothetical protein